MRYSINKTNYCNFNVFEDNKLAPRSYFIPYPDRESADKVSAGEKRYKSPKVICLNRANGISGFSRSRHSFLTSWTPT